MPKKGFNRDAKAIANILHNDPGLRAALNDIAADIAKEVDGEVIEYDTDRYVAAVKVYAWKQARDGALSKAVGARGKTLS